MGKSPCFHAVLTTVCVGGEGVTFYFLFAALVYAALPNSGATLRGANFFSEELTIIKKGGKKKLKWHQYFPGMRVHSDMTKL